MTHASTKYFEFSKLRSLDPNLYNLYHWIIFKFRKVFVHQLISAYYLSSTADNWDFSPEHKILMPLIMLYQFM